MPFGFQVEAQDGFARVGRMQTAHGTVETPVFMPVGTQATVKGVPQEMLEELGVEILLNNTYHLYLRPGIEAMRTNGGAHRFMAWPRAILTDSGGFQVWSLSSLRKLSEQGVEFRSHLDGSTHFFSPESSMAAQVAIGADIIMAFDECTECPATYARSRESMELTLRWAERCKRYFEEHKGEVVWGKEASSSRFGVSSKDSSSDWPRAGAAQTESRNSKRETQALFGIVQGGMYADLRRESAERTVEIGFPGYAIGGLSVGESREKTREMVAATLPHLPAGQPRYLMGVGTPEEIVEYAAMGVDMMDCVLPTRAARHGLLFTSEGKLNIKGARYAADQGPLDPACHCPVCRRYSRAYLRHLYAGGEVLAQVLNSVHNLAFYLDTMRALRQAIRLGEVARFLSDIRSRNLNSPHSPKEDRP